MALNVSVDTMDRWLKGDNDRNRGRRAVIKKALARMSDEIQQRTDAMAIFLLKQPCYGGYSDKASDTTGEGEVHIRVTFGGKGAAKAGSGKREG